MAIHYDAKLKRFRDDSGKLVSRQRAWRSSTARAEFAKAQKVLHAKPKAKKAVKKATAKVPAAKKPQKKVTAKAAVKVPAAKKPQKKAKAKPPKRIFPWDVEGVIREYPEPQDWFPDIEEPDYDYGYDDLLEDWGDFEDEDTTS